MQSFVKNQEWKERSHRALITGMKNIQLIGTIRKFGDTD